MSKKMGRPEKRPTLNLDQVEALGQYGLTEAEIADMMGVGLTTLKKWKKNPDFAAAIKKGKNKADAKIVKSLYLKAFGYVQLRRRPGQPDEEIHVPGDTTAMIFWLKNRQPDRWKDRHDQVLGGLGQDGAIRIEVVHVRPDGTPGNGNGNGKEKG